MAPTQATKPASPGRASVSRVLYPTDFSPACTAALDHAVRLARLEGAELHLLHVVAYPEGVQTSEAALKDACGAARKRLEELGAGLVEVASVTFAVRVGSPHVEVIAYARAEKVDLVVMGTAGLSGDHANPLGSTAERVIRGLDIPVLTVKSPPPAKPAGRVCSLCAKPSTDVICDPCKEAIHGEALHRRFGKG